MDIKFDSILGELRESDAGASNTTASNIGTDGVGLFKQKTADNLEFYNLVGDSGSLIGVETPDVNGNIVLLPNAGAIFEAGISGNEGNIDHNALGSLQGGTLAEYYHLTSAQHTIVGNTSGTNTGDNATNNQYSGLASSKQDALSGTGFVKISGTTISYDNSTYLTSQTSHADVVVDGDFSSQGIMLRGASSGVYSILTDNSANWNTAYGWGNHALGGYLTSLTGAVLTDQTVGQTIGLTGARLTKLWATDIEVTNSIVGSITGSASTLTTTRTLWGQNFNGSANVSGALTGVGDITTGNNPTFSWGSNTLSLRSTNAIGVIAIKGSTVNDYAPRLDIYEGTTTTVNVSLSGDGDSYFNGGDFGIGNTNPTQKLHVTGNAYVTGAMGIGTTPTTTADLRINSTATHESSLYAGIWQSTSYNPVGTPVAGTSVRGLLFQVSTPNVADDLSNVILYGALGQVTHGGSGALGQAIGMNPGVFLTGSGNVTTSAGITLSATASGGGAHTTFYGFRAGGITLSGGSTMVNSYAFYADAVTGATNNYAWLSNAGLFVVNETGDASSDLRVEGDTNTHLFITDASADCVGINVTAPAGKLDIQQTSTTATIPTLILDQSDLSEEFIQLETTVGTGNPLDTGALGTYYCKARVSVNGTFKFIALYNV